MVCNQGIALVNSRIITMDKKFPLAEAIYIRNGKITLIGKNDKIISQARVGDKIIDLQGLVVLPGFIDAHVHLMELTLTHLWVDLREVKSIDELKEALKRVVKRKPKGSWIFGRGWDHEKFKERRYPTKLDLDEVSKEHFIVIVRTCGHLYVVNTKVLELFPKEVYKEHKRVLSDGIIKGNLVKILHKLVPSPTPDELKEAMKIVLKELVKTGITTVHNMSVTSEELRILQELKKEEYLLLKVRLYIHYSLIDELEKLGIEAGFGDDFLKILGIKIVLDGSLGARTAALKEPYSDDPENFGLFYVSYDELKKLLIKCKKLNLQPSIHVIGDKAVQFALNAIHEVYGNDAYRYRPRLEHASLISTELIDKAKRINGLVVCIQPSFIISDFWAIERIGRDRIKWLYPFNSLFKAKIKVAIGSDSPVETFDPFYQIYAITTRGQYENVETYRYTHEERVGINNALQMYTIGGAYAAFEEKYIGSLSPGKCADLIILSKNPLETPPSDIKEIKVLATIVNGNFVYRASEFDEFVQEYEL